MPKIEFRDVYPLLQKIRNFLIIARTPHLKHNRFMPLLAPRSIPPPDIPRGPEFGYAKLYYLKRHAKNSVQPPVVAPIGIEAGGSPTKKVCPGRPTPGPTYWFDKHCYYVCVPDYVPSEQKQRPEPPSEPSPCKRPDPPCKPPPIDPCDPCQPPKKTC